MKWDRRAQFQVSNVGIHFVFFPCHPSFWVCSGVLALLYAAVQVPNIAQQDLSLTPWMFRVPQVMYIASSFVWSATARPRASSLSWCCTFEKHWVNSFLCMWTGKCLRICLQSNTWQGQVARRCRTHWLHVPLLPSSLFRFFKAVFSPRRQMFSTCIAAISSCCRSKSLLSFHFLLLLLNHLLLSIDDSLLSFDCFLLVLNQQQKFIAWSDRPINAERHVGFKYKMQELDTVNCFRIHQFKNKHWTWGRGPIPSLGPLTLPNDMFPCHRCRVMGPGTVSLEKRFGWHIWNIRNIWNIWNLWNIWSIWNIRNIWNIQNIWKNSNIWKIWNIWNIVNIWNVRYIQNIRDIVCNILRQQKVDHRRVCYHIYIYEIYEWIKYNIMIHAHILSAISTAFFLGVSLKKTSSRHTWGVLPILVKIIGCCHPPSPRLPFASSNSLTDLLEITFLQSFFQPWREKQ